MNQLIKDMQLRFPNVMPPVGTSFENLCILQGNLEVIRYILDYVTHLEEDRESLLRTGN